MELLVEYGTAGWELMMGRELLDGRGTLSWT